MIDAGKIEAQGNECLVLSDPTSGLFFTNKMDQPKIDRTSGLTLHPWPLQAGRTSGTKVLRQFSRILLLVRQARGEEIDDERDWESAAEEEQQESLAAGSEVVRASRVIIVYCGVDEGADLDAILFQLVQSILDRLVDGLLYIATYVVNLVYAPSWLKPKRLVKKKKSSLPQITEAGMQYIYM